MARRSHLMVLMAAILAVVAHPTPAQDFYPYVLRETGTPCLHIRAAPTTAADSVGCLAPGTAVTGIDTAPYWRQIRLADGREGWAAKRFLEPVPPPTTRQSSACYSA